MTDQELINFATDFRSGLLGGQTPCGMCFAVCAPLASLLRLHGVDAIETEVDLDHLSGEWASHWHIGLTDGRVLDPTADQFEDMPQVYLGEPKAFHKSEPNAGETP